jgi:hypothetical protein
MEFLSHFLYHQKAVPFMVFMHFKIPPSKFIYGKTAATAREYSLKY